jgi:putative hydrolase of the HAD superfamily
VAALGLTEFVDAIVFAAECGDGRGKPDRAPFVAMLKALNVTADRAVFVGDDMAADILGASRVGMRAIHVDRDGWRGVNRAGVRPHARVQSLGSVPRVAARLVEGDWHVRAA